MTEEGFPQLTLEQRRILEARLLLKQRPPEVPRLDGPKPLSPAQESLWLTDQFVPGSPLYNIPQAFRIVGKLDLAALQKSCAAIIARHDALRTQFGMISQQLRQTVLDQVDFKIQVHDLSSHEPATRSAEAARLVDQEARRPFQLDRAPLMRVLAVKLSAAEHILCLNLHHIISDDWSLKILFREVSELYRGYTENREVSLPELKVQFTDLAAFQRSGLDSRDFAGDLSFWRERFVGAVAPLTLPIDRPRTPQTSFAGAWRPLTIPATLVGALKELGHSENLTLYLTALAVFHALLYRYGNAGPITVGSPSSRREHPGSEGMVGMLITTLPVRINVSGEMTFHELLQAVRNEILGCYRHVTTRFEKILQELPVPRVGGRHPLFQVAFQLVAAADEELSFPETQVEEWPLQTGTSKFDLTFTLMEKKGALTGNVEFAADLFDAATVDRMAGHYRVLLEGIIAQPTQPIDELPLLTAAEHRQIVVDWNETTTNYPREKTVPQLFDEQAKKTPQAVALAFGAETMTYGELNARADRRAGQLQSAGVVPGAAVGVCLERSFELIISLLAILKSGAAYLPLDPDYPASRIAYMVGDSSAPFVITAKKLAERLPDAVRTILVDEKLRDEIKAADIAVSPESVAYIIYTSGSTGMPKGVAIPHRAIVRLVKETNYASFDSREVFLQFAPVSFDASTFEIWGPLLNGATLAIYPARFDSLEQFGQVLRRHRVTTLWLTAGLFQQMVDYHLEELRGVRQLLAGGDVLSPAHVKKLLDALPGCTVINGYGPTENTTFTCCYSAPPNGDGGSVPIGRPISNTRVYILDGKMKPTPIGIPGELYIAGDGLALGYLNSDALTAEKFVPDPFAVGGGGRLYRSGDAARYRPDGLIEFLGRKDEQVKVRGFRVELGEIEQALMRHPEVREAAVNKELAAYYVVRPGAQLEGGALREWLAGQLPAYMIPTHFVALERLPLTANGKVDRKALPVPAAGEGADEKQIKPRNEGERKLAEIWREVLEVEQIGVQQNFFELGGHSLLATRVVSRVHQSFGCEIPLLDVFEHPTIAALAAVIAGREKSAPGGLSLIPRRPRRSAPAAVTDSSPG